MGEVVVRQEVEEEGEVQKNGVAGEVHGQVAVWMG